MKPLVPTLLHLSFTLAFASPSPPLLLANDTQTIHLIPRNTLFLRQLADLQTFAQALGGVRASAITNSGDPQRPFSVDGQTFDSFDSASQRSCDNQFQGCQVAANANGNQAQTQGNGGNGGQNQNQNQQGNQANANQGQNRNNNGQNGGGQGQQQQQQQQNQNQQQQNQNQNQNGNGNGGNGQQGSNNNNDKSRNRNRQRSNPNDDDETDEAILQTRQNGGLSVQQCDQQKNECRSAQQVARVQNFETGLPSTNIGPDPQFPDFDLICDG